jgi:hypothetical protein
MFNMSPFGDSTDLQTRTRSTVPGDGPGLPVRFAKHKQPVSSNCLYQSLTVLTVGGSVRYLVRESRCTVIIDWVLANCRTQKSFLFTWKRHVCTPLPPSEETGNHAIASVIKKLLHFLYPLVCFYLLYVGLLLHGQASKSRMDLWNTLYNLKWFILQRVLALLSSLFHFLMF